MLENNAITMALDAILQPARLFQAISASQTTLANCLQDLSVKMELFKLGNYAITLNLDATPTVNQKLGIFASLS